MLNNFNYRKVKASDFNSDTGGWSNRFCVLSKEIKRKSS